MDKTTNFFHLIDEKFKKYLEAVLLSLRRINEIWLLLSLGMTNNLPNFDVIREAEIEGIINKHQEKLLRKIRSFYNSIKHKAYFNVDGVDVHNLIEEFSNLFSM